MKPDLEQIGLTWDLFHVEDGVLELRVLNAEKAGTVSGYYTEREAFIRDAARGSGKAPAVYVSANPAAPVLLARSANRATSHAKHTTSDPDITCRRFLLIDCDPDRPAGISSSEAEHEAALARCQEIQAALHEAGFPDPFYGDSGNGGHLGYRVDLSNDEASRILIERCLKALAFRFDGDGVKVDVKTGNAARIWKVYGTLAAKGDDLPERPHRLARLLKVPAELLPVPAELLGKLAASLPEEPKSERQAGAKSGPFPVQEWIDRHGLAVVRQGAWQGGQRWVLEECQWDHSHRDNAAWIVLLPSGAVAAGCQHNSCAGKGWHELRDAVEPGWRKPKDPAPTLINLSDADAPSTPRTEPNGHTNGNSNGHRKPFAEFLPPPDETAAPFPLQVFPEAVQQFARECARALPCPVDYLGVFILTVAAAAIGTSRALQIKPGWIEGPRIFSGVIAETGSKKTPALELATRPLLDRQSALHLDFQHLRDAYAQDAARYETEAAAWREMVKKAAKRGDHEETAAPVEPAAPHLEQLVSTDATIEGLMVLLQRNPRGILFFRDELTAWVRAMDAYRAGRGADRQAWLSFWSGSAVLVNRKTEEAPIYLRRPFVCVTGCLPPDVLGDLSDERGRDDGFVHRILFSFPAPVPGGYTEHGITETTTNLYAAVIGDLLRLTPATDEDGNSVPRLLQFDAPGKAVFVEWMHEHLAEPQARDFHPELRGHWAKLEGYMARLSLVVQLLWHAAGETGGETVGEDAALRAAALMDYFKSHARRVYERLHSTEEDQRILQAVNWIKRQDGGSVTLRNLMRNRVCGVRTATDGRTLFRDLVDRGFGEFSEDQNHCVTFSLGNARVTPDT